MQISLIVLVIIVLLYFWAIAPRLLNRPDYKVLEGHYYAHRGLHDNKTDAPENTMRAFQKAIDAGYGIELDVQLTKDRIPVVFHDETLQRVCGINGNVRDYTYAELQEFRVCGSNEKIPLFEDFLKLVHGQVPLIIEIKIHENHNTVCTIADKLIENYEGVYCIESFDPRAVQWYKKHRPEVIRGQLSSALNEPGKPEPFTYVLVHYLLLNVLGRPDFIAYEHVHKKNISRVLCVMLFNALSVAWTIRSQSEIEACKKEFSLFIFEGFIPSSVQNR